jgi:nucleotide-binding universal stress UspA family protein
MFRRIFVPLDGSTRAEQAIPVAARIARAVGGTIVLLQVDTTSLDFAWQTAGAPMIFPEDIAAERVAITQYLEQCAASKSLEGIETEVEVAEGVPARAIRAVAQARKADLIVLCSRGYSGVTRWLLGSVAQKVARQSAIPVLILREGAGIPTNLHPEGMRPVRVMVPLDGSELAEAALSPAATLAAILSAPLAGRLHLVLVLSLSWMSQRSHDEQTVAARARILAEAQTYLKAAQQRMRESMPSSIQLEVSSSLIVDEDVAGALIRAAECGKFGKDAQEDQRQACDVIAMATHGRGGLERWALGSITERVLEHTRLPLLILRPEQLRKQAQEAGEGDSAKQRKRTDAGMPAMTNLP